MLTCRLQLYKLYSIYLGCPCKNWYHYIHREIHFHNVYTNFTVIHIVEISGQTTPLRPVSTSKTNYLSTSVVGTSRDWYNVPRRRYVQFCVVLHAC